MRHTKPVKLNAALNLRAYLPNACFRPTWLVEGCRAGRLVADRRNRIFMVPRKGSQV